MRERRARRSRRAQEASPSRVEGNAILRRWCAGIAGHVLSVGSGNDGDHEGARYRHYFSAADSYTTSDRKSDAPVQLEADVRNMPNVETRRYSAVFCHSVLEHVDDVFAAVLELERVLAGGGVLILAVPFAYPIHRAPADFWRFTEFGVRHMLSKIARLEVLELVGVDGPSRAPAVYLARARKP